MPRQSTRIHLSRVNDKTRMLLEKLFEVMESEGYTKTNVMYLALRRGAKSLAEEWGIPLPAPYRAGGDPLDSASGVIHPAPPAPSAPELRAHPDTKLRDLFRASNIHLVRAVAALPPDVVTLRDIVAKYDEGDLRGVPGAGPGFVAKLKFFCREAGLELRNKKVGRPKKWRDPWADGRQCAISCQECGWLIMVGGQEAFVKCLREAEPEPYTCEWCLAGEEVPPAPNYTQEWARLKPIDYAKLVSSRMSKWKPLADDPDQPPAKTPTPVAVHVPEIEVPEGVVGDDETGDE